MVLKSVFIYKLRSQSQKICTPNEMQSSRSFEQNSIPEDLHEGDNKN